MKCRSRLLAVILSTILCVSNMSVPVLAEEPDEVEVEITSEESEEADDLISDEDETTDDSAQNQDPEYADNEAYDDFEEGISEENNLEEGVPEDTPSQEDVPEVTEVDNRKSNNESSNYQEEIVASGSCGENVSWELDDAGTLTISGEGAMTDDDSVSFKFGWVDYGALIKKVIIEEGVTNIGFGAFKDRSGYDQQTYPYLTSISIPSSVTYIGCYAFAGTLSLSEVIIAEGLETIDARAFYECENLKKIPLPNTLRRIYDMAFAFSGLTEVVIPSSVTRLYLSTFGWCENLSDIYFCGNCPTTMESPFDELNVTVYYPRNDYSWSSAITKKYGADSITWQQWDAVIPTIDISSCSISLSENSYTYDGQEKKPTVIAKEGTKNLILNTDYTVEYSNNVNAGIASVHISGIGKYTGSVTLEFMINPKNISSATVAFYNPDKIINGDSVFYYTGSAVEPIVNIYVSGTAIQKDTDYSLSYENNTKSGTGYTIVTGKGNYTGTLRSKFIIYGVEYSFKDGILTITKWDNDLPAFTKPEDAPWYENRNAVKQVIIYGDDADSVCKIDNYAFQDYPVLHSVILEKTIPAIGNLAFSGDVVTIYQKGSLGNGPTSITEINGVTGWIIWDYETDYHLKLSGIGKMEDMTDESVQTAPWTSGYAYSENDSNSILEMTITDRITRVGNRTFRTVPSITNVYISDSVKEMGSYLFNETVDFDKEENNLELCRVNIAFKGEAFNLPEDAFYHTKLLAYVPPFENSWNEENMLDYGGEVSWGKIQWDYQPSDFVVPDQEATEDEEYNPGQKLIISGEGPMPDYNSEPELPWFSRCEDVSEIEISDTVTEIGNNAFYNMKFVSRLYVGKNVNRIGTNAFCKTGDQGNYEGGLQIAFSGNAPESVEENAFGSDYVSDGRLYPIDIYYPEDKDGWDTLSSGNWNNSYLAWIPGEPTHLIDRNETWGFEGNYNSQGVGQFGAKSDGYYLSSEDETRLLRNLNESEKKAVKKVGVLYRYNLDGNRWKKTYIESGGSCNGFSISEALLYGNMTSPDIITRPLGEFEKNSPSNRTKSLINYYHLQQYLPSMQAYKGEWLKKEQTEQLAELEEMIRQAQNAHEMVEISFERKIIFNTGHTIMGYALEEGAFHIRVKGKDYVFDHRILTYDPTDYCNTFLTTDGNKSGINYHTHAFYYSTNKNSDTYGMWMIPYEYMDFPCSTSNKAYTFNSEDNARLLRVGSGYNYLNAVDYETGSANFRRMSSHEILSTTEHNFDVTLNDGTLYEVRNGDIENVDDGTVVLGSMNGDDDSDELFIVFKDGVEEFTVQSNDGGWFSLFSANDGIMTTALLEQAGELSFGKSGLVTAKSDQIGRVCIDITKDDIEASDGKAILPEHTIQIDVDNVKEITGQFVDDGYAISTDTECDAVIKTENLDTDKITTLDCFLDNNPYLITSSDNGENNIAVRQDSDGNGTFDTIVMDQAIEEMHPNDPDDPIIAIGKLTKTVNWSLTQSYVLTIYGAGDMPDFKLPYNTYYAATAIPAYVDPTRPDVPWKSYNQNIKKVVVEDGITSIGDFAFCEGNDTEFDHQMTETEIGDDVTRIGDYAFAHNWYLKEIILKDKVAEIGKSAFAGCFRLIRIDFGKSLRKIGSLAFADCNLRKLFFHETMENIGEAAFIRNNYLKEVTFSSDVTEIGAMVFENCHDNLVIICPANSKIAEYAAQNGIHYETIKNEVITDNGSNQGTSNGTNTGTAQEININTSTGPVTAPTSIIARPKGVKVSKLKSGKRFVTIKWRKGKSITGYEIQYGLKKNFKKAKKKRIKKAKTTSVKIKKLKSKKRYYFRIRTYKTVKGKKYYSAWSKAKSVKVK